MVQWLALEAKGDRARLPQLPKRRRKAPALSGWGYKAYFAKQNRFRLYSIDAGSSMALQGSKSNNNVVYSSKYHCVWTPKYRRSVLVGPIAKRCEQVIRQTAEKYRAEIIALEIMPDHVPVLVEVDPAVRHPPMGQESQGSFLAPIAARGSHIEITATHTLDESLFRIHGWRGTTGGHKAIC